MLPVLQVLSQDPEQVVRDAISFNIRALLAALPPGPARLAQLGFLSRMHPEDGSSCGQWRMRLLIAEQLAGIAALLQQQGLAEVLLPATLRLCEDPVAAVREAAAAQLGCMVGALLLQASSGSGSGSGSGRGGQEEEEEDEEQQQEQQQQQQQGVAPSPAGEQQAEAALQTAAAGPAEAEDTAAKAAADAEPGEAAPAPPPTPPLPPAAAAEASAEQDAETFEPAAAAAAAAAAPPAAEQQSQQPQQPQQEPPAQQPQPQPQPQRLAASPAAAVGMVQQIAQHMVELQRSSCHRARQTYLAFCTALLLPPSGEAAHAAPAAAAAVWPALAQSVASSGTVQGLLEGALALAADPVPNVRLGVARLLAALRRQQPLLAAGSPKVAAALGALVADSDRDVQQVAAVAAAAATAE
jgi:hypothetical protein